MALPNAENQMSVSRPTSFQVRNRIRRIVEHLAAYNPRRIYLFGSWARKEADEFSDVDLVVIMDSELPFVERCVSLGRQLPAALGGVDLLVYTPAEFDEMLRDGNPFAEMIMEEGKVIYERVYAPAEGVVGQGEAFYTERKEDEILTPDSAPGES
jgi:predicted nucleotidyltransferase